MTVTDNKILPMGSEFGTIGAIDYRLWFQKWCSIFHIFQLEFKTKSVMDLRNCSTFSKNVVQIVIGALGRLKKYARWYGVAIQLSLSFPAGKWVIWNKTKTSNISSIMPPIFFIYSPYDWKNNGLLNKN